MAAIMMISMFRAKHHAARHSHSRSSRIAMPYRFDGNEERDCQRALSDANQLTPKLCMPTPNFPAMVSQFGRKFGRITQDITA